MEIVRVVALNQRVGIVPPRFAVVAEILRMAICFSGYSVSPTIFSVAAGTSVRGSHRVVLDAGRYDLLGPSGVPEEDISIRLPSGSRQ